MRFLYVATGAEGSDFLVTLPGGPRANTNYIAIGQCAGVNMIVGMEIPAADYTTTQIHVITTGPLTAGDTLAFEVADRT